MRTLAWLAVVALVVSGCAPSKAHRANVAAKAACRSVADANGHSHATALGPVLFIRGYQKAVPDANKAAELDRKWQDLKQAVSRVANQPLTGPGMSEASIRAANLATEKCDKLLHAPDSNHALVTVNVGIIYSGGPAPGINPTLQSGKVQLTRDGNVIGTLYPKTGTRAAFRIQPGSYLATANAGSTCPPITVTASQGPARDFTIICHIR